MISYATRWCVAILTQTNSKGIHPDDMEQLVT